MAMHNLAYVGLEKVMFKPYGKVPEVALARQLATPMGQPRILLIDDDPLFGKKMKRAARNKNIDMTFCRSPLEVDRLQNLDYDVVLVDENLGDASGVELARYIEQVSDERIPAILISQTDQLNSSAWPESIREFINKRVGAYSILEAAFEAHEVNTVAKLIDGNG
jgi:CheY-like chemotaxis protein